MISCLEALFQPLNIGQRSRRGTANSILGAMIIESKSCLEERLGKPNKEGHRTISDPEPCAKVKPN